MREKTSYNSHVPSQFCQSLTTVPSVATEAPPAGEFGRSSGQTSGRGSPVGNIKSPALSGAPVPAEDPVLTGDSGYIRLENKRY